MAEGVQAFLEEIRQSGHPHQVGGRMRPVAITGERLRVVPFGGPEIAAAYPGEGDEFDDLVVVQVVDRFTQFILGRVARKVLEDLLRLFVDRIGTGIELGWISLDVEFARLGDDVPFPFLLLLVSGGHCQILTVYGVGYYEFF